MSLIEKARVARFLFQTKFELIKWKSIDLELSFELQISSRAWASMARLHPNYDREATTPYAVQITKNEIPSVFPLGGEL